IVGPPEAHRRTQIVVPSTLGRQIPSARLHLHSDSARLLQDDTGKNQLLLSHILDERVVNARLIVSLGHLALLLYRSVIYRRRHCAVKARRSASSPYLLKGGTK